jgi:hypothetical protein
VGHVLSIQHKNWAVIRKMVFFADHTHYIVQVEVETNSKFCEKVTIFVVLGMLGEVFMTGFVEDGILYCGQSE